MTTTALPVDPSTLPTHELAKAVHDAVERLGSEEHRYVERFYPCPNGCEFDNASPPQRLAGPEHCDQQCFYGSLEDDDAPHIDADLAKLSAAADRLLELERKYLRALPSAED